MEKNWPRFASVLRGRSHIPHILRNQQGRGFQMLTVDYGGGLAVDYVIKNLIFTLILYTCMQDTFSRATHSA